MSDVLLAAGSLDSQLLRADHHGRVGDQVLRDQDVYQASRLRPPVIWPRFVPTGMQGQSAGACVAPITNELTTTTVRDAKHTVSGRGP